MLKGNKKILKILACASAIAGSTAFIAKSSYLNEIKIVRAANSVAAHSYGADVASYQASDLSNIAKNGGQFAIVKLSEGTGYQNPKAAKQIQSAVANNMMPMAYHFATFGANSNAAVAEANYAVSSAQKMGLPQGAYIACDWESGQGNNITAGKNPSATAILAFMDQIKQSGYQPLLYSSASWLNNNINTRTILAKYSNSLWVASYATIGRIDTANFGNFPSMNGVAIWQFTDNWRGLNVDGNIMLLPLAMNTGASTQAPSNSDAATNINKQAEASNSKATPSNTTEDKNEKTIMHKAYIYNKNGKRSGTNSLGAYQHVVVLGGIVKIGSKNYYKIGSNEYIVLSNVDGTRRTLKHNSYVYNNNGARVGVPTIKSETMISTYGSSMNINGKKYYRINKNRYVKKNNF